MIRTIGFDSVDIPPRPDIAAHPGLAARRRASYIRPEPTGPKRTQGIMCAMQEFEYKVVPAPDRGEKAKGAKTAADRFAQALTTLLNQMARDGWDYVRAEMLPSEERSGFTRRTTVYHNVLVFRRLRAAAADQPPAPRQLTAAAPAGKAPRLDAPSTDAPAATRPASGPEPEAKAGDGKPRKDSGVA